VIYCLGVLSGLSKLPGGKPEIESFAFRRKTLSDAWSMVLARAEEMGHHVPERFKKPLQVLLSNEFRRQAVE
jgi:hypothetical protein